MNKVLERNIKFAKFMSEKSTCLRRKVGAVIMKGQVVLSTGYNGAPDPAASCSDCGGCLRKNLNVPSGQRHELCRGVHAEQDAINKAAKQGISINGATLYCTTFPCSMCAKSIISSGIKTVYYTEDYPDELAKELFSYTDIELIKLN